MSAFILRNTGHSKRTSKLALLRTAVLLGACAPLVASCATGFDAPTRHAVANMQAASVDVGPNLQVRDLIIALPDGTSAAKGSVAYIEFTATNHADQADELQAASAQVDAPASSAPASSGAPASSAAAAVDVSSQQLPMGGTKVPARTTAAPGVARLIVALDPLNVPLAQGESVRVSLVFANAGSVDGIYVPVQGNDVVGSSFLPSAPPSLPSTESPSAPASSEAPASSAPASAPASIAPTPLSSGAASSPAA